MAEPLRRDCPFGNLLTRWRLARGLSQLRLATEASISSRHLSFLETGRSQPSREMVLHLADALEVPLRERNSLLLAAGYAPQFAETALEDPEMAHVRHILDLMLTGYEPFGAVAVDRAWDIVLANSSFARLMRLMGIEDSEGSNILELLFSPEGLRPFIANWDEVGYHLIQRVHREALDAGNRPEAHDLLQSLLSRAGVPQLWRMLDVQSVPDLLVPVHLRAGDVDLRLFTAITTLGTPQDVTLQELRIEALLPADPASEAVLRSLAQAGEASASPARG